MHLAESLLYRGPGGQAPGSLGPLLRDLGLLPPPAASPHHLLLGCRAAARRVPAGPSTAGPLGHPAAALFPRLLRPFGVPAKVQSPFLLGPGTRGGVGREARGRSRPSDARAQTTRAAKCWALRRRKAAGILPRPGRGSSVGVGGLRGARRGAPRTAGARARVEREPGRLASSCSRRRRHAQECHLRDTRRPAGSGGGGDATPPSQPGSGRRRNEPDPAGGGYQHCPGREAGGAGRPPEPTPAPPPRIPLLGSCQSPPAHHSAAVMPTPPLSSRAFRPPHSPLQPPGGGGRAVTGEGFNSVFATGIERPSQIWSRGKGRRTYSGRFEFGE